MFKNSATRGRALTLLREGLHPTEVAERLGKSASVIRTYLYEARKVGTLPNPKTSHNGSRARVVAMLKDGMRSSEVAALTGLATGTVNGYAAWARRKGALNYRTTGRAENVVAGLSFEVASWLASITPEGADVSDTIRSILVDAYEEEKDAK